MFSGQKHRGNIIYYAEAAAVISVCFLLLVNFSSAFSKPFSVAALYLFYCAAVLAVFYVTRDSICRGSVIKRMAFVMAAAFAIRLPAVYFLNLTMQGDYAIYLSTARKIATGTLSDSNKLYYGIFPHALNYPIFISFFYRLFGEKTWLPRIINLFFGVIEAGAGAYILEKFTGPRTGVLAGLAVALNPSVIIFTLLSGGEPVYSSIILCAVLVFTAGIDREKHYPFMAAFGIISALGNFFRPTALILIIASVMVILLCCNFSAVRKILSAGIIVLSYAIVTLLLGAVTASVSGYESPSYGFGWNLYVGANEESQGRWNEKDGELFEKIKNEYQDPSEIQEYFFFLFTERYKNMGIRVIRHFKRKLSVWFDENYVSMVVTGWQTAYTRFKSSDLRQTFYLIANSFNIFIVTGAAAAMLILSLNRKDAGTVKILSYYMAGVIILYMLLETATRYKGAYYSTLTLLAVYGYRKILNFVKIRCDIKNKKV